MINNSNTETPVVSRRFMLSALTLGLGAAALPQAIGTAAAQGVVIGPGGVYVDPGRRPPPPPPRYDRDFDRRRRRFGGVSRGEAIAIAQSRGVVEVLRVDSTDRRWIVGGYDRRGNGLEVFMSNQTGEILQVRRARIR